MVKNNLITVVIPSYNEVKNLSILISEINRELKGCTIIIVDDSLAAENLRLKKIVREYKNVYLISRQKKLGRGSAVLEGFKEALKNKHTKYMFEMDSDLAHDPREMTRFIEKIENFDLIIGSRYIPGGKIINIAPNRTIMSRLINKFLYYWLGMHLSDHTSGFRLYKREAVEYLVNIRIKSRGFITLSEIAYKLHLARFKIGEVPITWNYRIYGKSNVNLRELLTSLFFIISMKLEYLFYHHKKWKIIFFSVVIFVFALSIRLSSLNQMGRTWDEPEYVSQGYKMDELLLKKDFSNSYFYTTYDHPPLVKYLYGITAHLDIKTFDMNKIPDLRNYEYTYSREFSAIMGSFSAVLVFLIAYEFASLFVAIVSGIIFSTLPFFVGLSQQVTTESFLMFFFTLSSYLFIKILKNFNYKTLISLGILTGLALLIKQSNALLFPLYVLFYLTYYFNNMKIKLINKKIVVAITVIFILSCATFIILWPMPFTHLDYISKVNQQTWLVKTSPPEVFWGKLMLSPVIYFPTMFFVTTPLLIIILSLFGLKNIEKRKNWFYYALIVWFLFPFIQSFYAWRMHAVRYIIEIYAPLSIIAGLGLEEIVYKFKKNVFGIKTVSIILILTYSIITLYKISPYYLSYYNELVGGAKGVYENKYFHLGWWGEGMREAGIYLNKNASKNSLIGLAVSPILSFPPSDKFKLVSYEQNNNYDYVVVNYYHVLREGFNDSYIKKNYRLIHQVFAGGAPIVDIYSKRN